MPLAIKQLNADSTFLLTFTAPPSVDPSPRFLSPRVGATPPATPATTASTAGTFSILLDPWLTGPTKIFHHRFARASHRHPACISSLRDVPEPDLVIVSQAKEDHCNEDTLRQLPAEGGKSVVLAHPAAAKIIRGWRHFRPEGRVQALARYDHRHPARREATVRRFVLPPSSPSGAPGEVTVALMSDPLDLTGVHTAVGITYRPPSASVVFPAAIATTSPTLQPSSATLFVPPLTPPPDSPRSFHSMAMSSYAAPADRPISVVYSPHGVPYRLIRPYASTHLVAESALPLDLLLHSFDRVRNLWWLGGTIATGFPGGQEIAHNLLARYWISAHDEVKVVGGISTKPIKTHHYDRHRAQLFMTERQRGHASGKDARSVPASPASPTGTFAGAHSRGHDEDETTQKTKSFDDRRRHRHSHHASSSSSSSAAAAAAAVPASPLLTPLLETEMVTLDPGEELNI
ncbi:MAG: hypothetical protein M1815_005296 [Lichina confinis]|nr:MAG: hypothetical protein M1815_005296 [Lichina confinis]